MKNECFQSTLLLSDFAGTSWISLSFAGGLPVRTSPRIGAFAGRPRRILRVKSMVSRSIFPVSQVFLVVCW